MLKKDFISKPIIEFHCIYMQHNKFNMRQHMTVLQWQNAVNKITIAMLSLYRFCQFYTPFSLNLNGTVWNVIYNEYFFIYYVKNKNNHLHSGILHTYTSMLF